MQKEWKFIAKKKAKKNRERTVFRRAIERRTARTRGEIDQSKPQI